jgi:excisionase family DNA binding protein
MSRNVTKREDAPANRLLRPDDALAILAISRTKLYELMSTGQLAFVLVGSDRRIEQHELDRFIRRHRVERIASPE